MKRRTIRRPERWMRLREIAALVDRHPNSIGNQIAKAGLRARKSDGKYFAPGVLRVLQEAIGRDLRGSADSNPRYKVDELRAQKLEYEIRLLTGQSVAIEDHQSAVRELAQMFVDGLGEAETAVSAVSRDAATVLAVQEQFDQIRARLAKRIAESGNGKAVA